MLFFAGYGGEESRKRNDRKNDRRGILSFIIFSFTTTTAAADGQLFPYKSSSIEVEVPMYTTLELCTQSLVYTTKKATESRYYELYYVFFLLVPWKCRSLSHIFSCIMYPSISLLVLAFHTPHKLLPPTTTTTTEIAAGDHEDTTTSHGGNRIESNGELINSLAKKKCRVPVRAVSCGMIISIIMPKMKQKSKNQQIILWNGKIILLLLDFLHGYWSWWWMMISSS